MSMNNQASEVREISFEEWDEQYDAVLNRDGMVWWEADEVGTAVVDLAIGERNVWTLIEGGDGERILAFPGYHLVNRVGYIVSVEPWSDADRETLAVVYDDGERDD